MTQPPRSHPPRKLRNFLLEPRFQLKYTSMVVGVTVVVAAVLGSYAYRYSTGQTQLLNIQRMEALMDRGGEPDEQFISDLERYAREADRKVALAILGAILVLAMALGVTGVVVTHRLVGPAYRLRQLIARVAEGKLRVDGGLRRGDELQDLYEAFRGMVGNLRGFREQQIEALEAVIARAKAESASEQLVADLERVRERLRGSLD